MDPFQSLVEQLRGEQRLLGKRAVFLKAMPADPISTLHAVRIAQGKHDDRRISAGALDTLKRRTRGKGRGKDFGEVFLPPFSERELLDAMHRRTLQPGDMDRIRSAEEMGLPIPADIVTRVKGTATK